MQIYLLECEVYTDNSPAVETIRLSTGDGYNHPSASGFYEGRIIGKGGLQVLRTIFSGGNFGMGDIRYGLLDVVNNDAALDEWLTYGWGRTATLKLGDSDANYSTFETVLTATIDGMTPANNVFSLQWTARYLPLLSNPVVNQYFLGNNADSPSTGLEGGEELRGVAKPRAKGKLRNITPVMINTAERLFAWNYDKNGAALATHAVDAVYYRGVSYSLGSDYANSTLLRASSPSTGQYNTCLAESMILVGGSQTLNGDVTVDVTIEATASNRYAGSLLQYFMLDAGIDSGDVSSADVTALNAEAPYEMGIYIQTETYLDACNAIADSVGAWYMPDRLGVFRMAQINAPVGTEDIKFVRFDLDTVADTTTFELLSLKPVASTDFIVPAKEVQVGYQKNWKVLTGGDIAASVSEAERQFFTNEYRYTDLVTDAGNAAKYLNAKSLTFNTLLYNKADADDMAQFFADIFAVQRREYDIEVAYSGDAITQVDLGKIAKITYPKLGLSAGKLFAIHAVELNAKTNTASIKVWG